VSSGVIRLSIGFVKERVKLAAPEPMCLERAALAKEEMEHGLMEAQEWKELRNSTEPFDKRISNRSSDLAEPNNS
jgi:hypothetical protein